MQLFVKSNLTSHFAYYLRVKAYYAPLFLYTSWRTGGTALAHAIRQVEGTCVFIDPLNDALAKKETMKQANSSSWHSNHPKDYLYFEEYLDLFEGETIPSFPNPDYFKFRNASDEYKLALVRYLEHLVNYASEKNRTAVFKFEQLEGLSETIRKAFPFSSHIGIFRNADDQYLSWLEQSAISSEVFFRSAKLLIKNDEPFFNSKGPKGLESREAIFKIYRSGLDSIRNELDLNLDIMGISKEENLEKIRNNKMISIEHKLLLTCGVRLLNDTTIPNFRLKFERLLNIHFGVMQQRDDLKQKCDDLRQQLDELVNSKTWKLTQPIRSFISFLKSPFRS